MPRSSCSFVIPAYNEATRLESTLYAIAELSASHLGACEIIVADDGSTDSTAEIARAFQVSNCSLRVVTLPHRGKGSAVRQGVSVARNEIIVLCDADMQDSVSEVLFLVKAVERGVDIAIGSRWSDPFNSHCSQPLYRRLASRVFNRVVGRILALPFRDTQCGLKAMTRDAATRIFPMLNLNGWGYDTELIHVALAQGLSIEEVDLHLVHDYSNTHFRPISDGCAVLLELLEIRWNDLRGVYGEPVLGSASFQRVLGFSRSIGSIRPTSALSTQTRAVREVAECNVEPVQYRPDTRPSPDLLIARADVYHDDLAA